MLLLACHTEREDGSDLRERREEGGKGRIMSSHIRMTQKEGREGRREGRVLTIEETLHNLGPSEAVLDPGEHTPLMPQLYGE